jgi:hypothetical protein
VGRNRAGPRAERHQLTTAQGATRLEWAVGRQRPPTEIVFLYFYSQIIVFIVFVQFFGQISYSFLYSNYSNEKSV